VADGDIGPQVERRSERAEGDMAQRPDLAERLLLAGASSSPVRVNAQAPKSGRTSQAMAPNRAQAVITSHRRRIRSL